MAERERRKFLDDKLAEDLDTVVSFLDPHLGVRSKARDKAALWSWRKTAFFVLVTGVIGWSAILGLIYLLTRLLG